MNKFPSLEQMAVTSEATLRDALNVIDLNGQGACFIIDKDTLIGVLSDGDIRRALLEGKLMDSSVLQVSNDSFVSLPINTPLKEIQKKLKEYIRIIPIVNKENKLVDFVTASHYHHIPLTQPVLDGNELEYVTDCILSGWISSQGKYVGQFEELFGKYVGNENTLAVSNGTVALHLALVTLGIGPGDEVIVPDLTFVAPVNAVLYVGATPVLVDVERDTMAIDIELAKHAVTDRTRAIIPVHLYGHPADMTGVMDLAEKHNLLVIEDCAEALGSKYKETHVGNFGDAAIFSFFGNKTITTGEGGMLLFKNSKNIEKARMLRDHGMSKERKYWYEYVGYNYRMTNIQAAIGVAQMERVSEFVLRKRWIAEHYKQCLSDVKNITLPGEFGEVYNSYWFYTIVLANGLSSSRDSIINDLIENGVEVRPVFNPMHIMPVYSPYRVSGENYPVANSLAQGISLPSSVTITESDIHRVCSVLRNLLEKYQLDTIHLS